MEAGGGIGTLGTLALGALGVAILLALARLVRGPSLPDRVVALDLIAVLSAAFATVYAMETEQPAFLDVAIVLALVAFLGTIAYAQYVERRAHDE